MAKENPLPITSERRLNQLLKMKSRTAQEISELAGALGHEIAKAVERDHLDRTAFNHTVAAARMSDSRLKTYLTNLDEYFERAGLRERAAKVIELPLNEMKEAAE